MDTYPGQDQRPRSAQATHGQPAYPQYAPPAPPKKKKGRTLLIVVGAVIALCIGGGVLTIGLGGNDTKAANDTERNAPGGSGGNAGNQAAGLNQPARDGKFEFVVKNVRCGIPQIGSDLVGTKAQGQFCEAKMTVKNIGNEAQLFDSSSQYAFNTAGQKYDADGGAGIYLGDEGNAFLNNINPGNTVTGTVVFDIPKDQKIVKLELHDSPFSGGVTVNIA